MSNKKLNAKELAISRVTVMLFSLILLSVLTYIYIIPFKKHYLQINDYYAYIEYTAMAVTFAAICGGCCFLAFKTRVRLFAKADNSQLFSDTVFYGICGGCCNSAQLKQNAVIQVLHNLLRLHFHSIYNLLLIKPRLRLQAVVCGISLRTVCFD